ncbi:unnamed protein product [Phytomonas sp. EM1]|nr:unnamed protein product [Phytomonas sp. EM1]|eukprot:CCW65192.1 unnamed protein product [Phytomonas sp. isolate EM1]
MQIDPDVHVLIDSHSERSVAANTCLSSNHLAHGSQPPCTAPSISSSSLSFLKYPSRLFSQVGGGDASGCSSCNANDDLDGETDLGLGSSSDLGDVIRHGEL